ncbi:uncharacterized protein GO595_002051 [Histomonas meleagridis]|uniref:uncharacterized protein n=1 Tax=Histomonas meleagridis TaxID=135588 RepID=UPI003559603D|nr:hypothetical protein GO595_002051 [Histomonas meleagridis]
MKKGNVERPKVETSDTIFSKVSVLCHKKITSVSEALTALSREMTKANVFPSKTINLAAKIAYKETEESLAWVEGIVTLLLNSASNQEDWFSKPRAALFLFGLNIGNGTNKEIQIRIIGDYVLTNFIPQNESQLIDHLKIANVFTQQVNFNKDFFPYGSLFIFKKVIFEKESFPFQIPQKYISSSVKLLETLITFPTVRIVSPEIVHGNVGHPQIQNLIYNAKIYEQRRIEEYRTQRIYPPMIQMIEPQISKIFKKKSEDDRLKQELKKERSKTKKELRRTREFAREEKEKEKVQKKRQKEKERRKVWAMLEAGRTDDLNMAAMPAHEDEEDQNENEDVDESSEE